MKVKIAIVIGTRPEAIKLAPVILEMQKSPRLQPVVCLSGQHSDLVTPIIDFFDISVDFVGVLPENASDLLDRSIYLLQNLKVMLLQHEVSGVCVHGDTATATMAAIAAYYSGLPVFHIEAGLRSFDLSFPWPEEANRRIISEIADLNFAPTVQASSNLRAENIDQSKIYVTGNTAIDALLMAEQKIRPPDVELSKDFELLVTMHRRENFGEKGVQICRALEQLSRNSSDIKVKFVLHKNPSARSAATAELGGNSNVTLLESLDYPDFVKLMHSCNLILTDSGGLQEEAPSLGKYVLVLRDVTERPEGVDLGLSELVGSDQDKIFAAVMGHYRRWKHKEVSLEASPDKFLSPYGNGNAATQIVDRLASFYERFS